MKKIIFFDIDGTLTKETDGTIPESCISAIRKARKCGHLMYINTGRCFQNVEPRFQEIGFDGIVCGCGTNLYSGGKELLYVSQTHTLTMEILRAARQADVDIAFESKYEVCFDTSRSIRHPEAAELFQSFRDVHHYPMRTDLTEEDFFCDKFVVWYQDESQLAAFRAVSDAYFDCIDRGGTFREFVPKGYSKATGIARIVAHHGISMENTFAIGDSNNDLPMLTAVHTAIAMGNASPASLFAKVSYVTTKASEDGILHALSHFGFLD